MPYHPQDKLQQNNITVGRGEAKIGRRVPTQNVGKAADGPMLLGQGSSTTTTRWGDCPIVSDNVSRLLARRWGTASKSPPAAGGGAAPWLAAALRGPGVVACCFFKHTREAPFHDAVRTCDRGSSSPCAEALQRGRKRSWLKSMKRIATHI